MESDDDAFFPPPSENSTPLHPTNLKRLRKASMVSVEEQPPEVSSPPPAQSRTTVPPSPIFPAQIVEKQGDRVSPLVGLDKDVMEEDEELDPLFGERGEFTGCAAAAPECGMTSEDLGVFSGGAGSKEGDRFRKKRSVKKRLDLEWGEEDSDKGNKHKRKNVIESDDGVDGGLMLTGTAQKKKQLKLEWGEEDLTKRKKKKKKIKNVIEGDEGADGDWTPIETTGSKRKLERERKIYLEQLHVESQRLLRETRDASFKPAPLVQKSISSVLEKIRLRKLEVSKNCRFGISSKPDCPVVANDSISEHIHNLDAAYSKLSNEENTEAVDLDTFTRGRDIPLDDATEAPLGSKEYAKQDEDLLASRNDHQTSVADIQDSTIDSPVREEIIGFKEQISSSESLHDKGTDSYSNLLDDSSSDEEDFNKENTDPLKDKPVHPDSFGTTDIANTFIDDEAEEEDDSDHDLMRFQENDEDDEGEENGLNDIIITSFEEKPIDQERRDMLHRKWLEQQDAADTENVLQRIKKRVKQRETSIIEDDDFIEDCSKDSGNASLIDDFSENNAHHQLKRQKKSIIQMFDDRDEGYVSSDEETERLAHQCLPKQVKNFPSGFGPDEGENSREVFSLIKKLNIAPNPKRRTKAATPSYDILLTGENSNSSSKSSFLGRTKSNSLPFSIKKGPSTFRSFIFGRDDSNSRNGISASDNISEMNMQDNKELQAARSASTKSSFSQSKLVVAKTESTDVSSPKLSLFQILRRSSWHSDQQQVVDQRVRSPISETQAAYQLAAFKLQKKAPRNSMKET